jgi:hypothetical protein
MRKILTATALSAAAVLGSIGVAASASATTAVKAVTISPLHTDTTSVSGSATQADPNRGPVWGADRLKEAITATHRADGKWNVKISFGGSTFAGFADPRSGPEGSTDPGGPLLSQGGITGSIQYNAIASNTAPDPSNVLPVQTPNTGLGAVLGQLFHGGNGAAASTHWLINYTPSMDSVNVTGSGDTWVSGDTYTPAG